MREQQPLRWDKLEAAPPPGQRFSTRIALPDVSGDVHLAIDAAKRRYVLVRIPSGEPDQITERASRGIAVCTVEGAFGALQLEKFVQIECLDSSGHSSLDGVVREIVDALAAGASIGTVRLVQNVLAKWRRFWGSIHQGVMPKEEQLGLFGELWFLHHWMRPAVGTARAAATWRGPVSARNDFESAKFAVEVKTSSRVEPIYTINGLEQLLEPEGGVLLLFALSVREEASGTESLPNLVQAIKGELSDDYASLSMFESMLYASKYEDEHAAEYAKLVLRVRNQYLYRVGPGFPRLVPDSISGGLPAGIATLTYQIRPDEAMRGLLARDAVAGSLIVASLID